MGYLDTLYSDADGPYALSGNVKTFVNTAKELGVPKKEVIRYLQGGPSFTLHRPRRVHFARSKTLVAPKVHELWQADLVEMQEKSSSGQSTNSVFVDGGGCVE